MSRSKFLIAALLLGALVLVQHASALRLPLFADDYLFLDRVRHVGFAQALELPDALGNFYRPLTRQAYFWVVAHVFGESAVACHAVNLLSLWAILLLLYAVVARRAGALAGIVAALFVGAHSAWDVPILWGSGTQELFAIAFALAAVLLFDAGKRWPSALAYALALLSKEVVGLLPVVLLVSAWTRERSLRAALPKLVPHALVAALWSFLWWSRMSHAPNPYSAGRPTVSWALATVIHAVQVLLGADGGPGAAPTPSQLGVTLGCAAIALVALFLFARGDDGEPNARGATATGVAWFLCATVPIALVVPFWSTYYYAFALCGAALVLGQAVWRRPRAMAAGALLVVLAGALWSRTRVMVEVPLGEWTPNSHISAAYVVRSERLTGTLVASLKRALPRPPRQSTLFFAGVPASIAFQVGDGPYVRWAYRDSSLRSYFLSEINDQRVNRGRTYVFVSDGDTLVDASRDSSLILGTAVRAIFQDDLVSARGALRYHRGLWPDEGRARALLAWLSWEQGEREQARALLLLGPGDETRPSFDVARAVHERLNAGDVAGAQQLAVEAVRRWPLDPVAHGLLADLLTLTPAARGYAVIEAYAARVLAPQDPGAWRRWGFVLANFGEVHGAIRSFARYRELAPDLAESDASVVRLERDLRAHAADARSGGQVLIR